MPFQFTRPAWGATYLTVGDPSSLISFQFTRPAWGATLAGRSALVVGVCFNSRAPHGARLGSCAGQAAVGKVSIHAPRMGRDLLAQVDTADRWKFQFTRPAWGATWPLRDCVAVQGEVSIHAPRMGRDFVRVVRVVRVVLVSIHAPRMGRDLKIEVCETWLRKFQFTRPAWGATFFRFPSTPSSVRFNSRAPHGARLSWHDSYAGGTGVSIHAPRMGRDFDRPVGRHHRKLFQFTRPAWGATCIGGRIGGRIGVSIHAPRMGRDFRSAALIWCRFKVSIHAPRMGRDFEPGVAGGEGRGFNSRAPHGARLSSASACLTISCVFQFTRPAWGATLRNWTSARGVQVSIHAPRMGRDLHSVVA